MHHSHIGGDIWKRNNKITTVEEVNERDLWEMEVNLRSREKEKRTLHFFVRGKQQKVFFKGVPDGVKFGV